MRYICPKCNDILERTKDGNYNCKKHGSYSYKFLDGYTEGYWAGFKNAIKEQRDKQ